MADPADQWIAQLERQRVMQERAMMYKGKKPLTAQKRPRHEILQSFEQMRLRSQMTGLMGRQQITTTMIPKSYPPCEKALLELTPIKLHEMVLETHHRGRFIVLRNICDPARMTSIMSGLEDQDGEVIVLAIYNFLPTFPMEQAMPKNSILAIKEPYLKVAGDGSTTLRIDHPSDLVLLKPGDKLIPPKLHTMTPMGARDQTAMHLKESGNVAFKKQDWYTAIDRYTVALDACPRNDDDLRRIIYRNRAATLFHLERFELAVTDALASLLSGNLTSSEAKSQNVKAHFRAGHAYYELGNFSDANVQYRKALELDPSHKECLAESKRTEQRHLEQTTGAYDFAAMAESCSAKRTRLDHASFIGRTKVGPAGDRGRGLFTTENIAAGQIIMVEKAFSAAFTGDDNGLGGLALLFNFNTKRNLAGTHTQRLYRVVDKLLYNPQESSRFLDLHSGYSRTPAPRLVDGKVIIDTFQVQSICELNGFGCPDVSSLDSDSASSVDGQPNTTGIWLRASYCNHSCVPNASRSFIGDMMIVRACRDIPAESEIFLGYCPVTKTLKERKEHLSFYGFVCHCPLCAAETKLRAATVKERARLVSEAEDLLKANPIDADSKRVSPGTIRRARALREKLEGTYDGKLYGTLPRIECTPLDLWLCQSSVREPPAEIIADALVLLRHLGYSCEVKDGGLMVDREHSIASPYGAHAAMYARQAYVAMGKKDVAAAFEELAREIYLVAFECMLDFEAKFLESVA